MVRTIAEELAGRAAVVQVDTKENQGLAARYGVRGIPALYFLRQGKVVDQLAGAQPLEAVISWFNRVKSAR